MSEGSLRCIEIHHVGKEGSGQDDHLNEFSGGTIKLKEKTIGVDG